MNNIYFSIEENGDTQFQRDEYIEDGWYIVNTDGMFVVWEIPCGGGNPQRYKSFNSFSEALKIAEGLT